MRAKEHEVLAFVIQDTLFGIPIDQIDLVQTSHSGADYIPAGRALGFSEGISYTDPKFVKRKKLPVVHLQVDQVAGILPVRKSQELPLPVMFATHARLLKSAIRLERAPFEGRIMMIMDIDQLEDSHA